MNYVRYLKSHTVDFSSRNTQGKMPWNPFQRNSIGNCQVCACTQKHTYTHACPGKGLAKLATGTTLPRSNWGQTALSPAVDHSPIPGSFELWLLQEEIKRRVEIRSKTTAKSWDILSSNGCTRGENADPCVRGESNETWLTCSDLDQSRKK